MIVLKAESWKMIPEWNKYASQSKPDMNTSSPFYERIKGTYIKLNYVDKIF